MPTDAAKIKEIAEGLYRLENIERAIREFTGEDEKDVWRRLCLEMENPGYNVTKRAAELGVTPHEFDDRMIELYSKSDGFIYETSVESRNPFRVSKWLAIVRFILDHSPDVSNTRILLYGDSVGSDSIFLSELGFQVYYYDYDSYCSQFAKNRFKQRGLDVWFYDRSETTFDFVICLEVAEHATDPRELIEELSRLTGPDGFCIFSEAFGMVTEFFPTHLASNLKYEGKTVELFAEVGMHLCWMDLHEKPLIFTKNKKFRVPKYQILRKRLHQAQDGLYKLRNRFR